MTQTPLTLTFAEKLAQARPSERTVTVCLRGDLAERYEQIGDEFTEAAGEDAKDSRLNNKALATLGKQLDELKAEMLTHSQEFTVRALPVVGDGDKTVTYLDLMSRHPARVDAAGKPHPKDRGSLNMDTFPRALVRHSVVSPQMTEDEFNQLMAVLNHRQFEKLMHAAFAVNGRDASIPTSPPGSKATPSSANGSKPRGSSESA